MRQIYWCIYYRKKTEVLFEEKNLATTCLVTSKILKIKNTAHIMSRQPPPNNDEQFASDLEAIENAMNNMMQGAFSMVFKELLGSDNNGIFEQFPHTTTTTTIIDGNNISTHREGNHIIEDEFGGSDFKRLANRSKQNRGLIPATPTTTTEGSPRDVTTTTPTIQQQSGESILPGLIAAAAGSIFNRMIQPEIMSKRDAGDIVAHQQKEDHDTSRSNDGGGWSFTSTSQRTVYNADGSQETIITKKSNGVTETIRQLHYPDGRVEESREQKNSFWNRIFG